MNESVHSYDTRAAFNLPSDYSRANYVEILVAISGAQKWNNFTNWFSEFQIVQTVFKKSIHM